MDKQKIAEETAEVVERTLDIIENVDEQVVTVVKNNPLVLAGVGVVGLALGGAAGFFAAKRYLEPKYAELAQQEVEDAKDFFERVNKVGRYATPEAAVETLHGDISTADEVILEEAAQAMRSYDQMFTGAVSVDETAEGLTVTTESALIEVEDGEVQVVKEVSNIFLDGKPIDRDFDFEAEAAKRKAGEPYVITEDEFMTNANDDTEVACTYYVADDTLIDDEDKVIDDIEATVGEKNMKRFGDGSNDRNMVYIRNEEKGLIFEVSRSSGSYLKEVLGMDDHEITRMNKRRARSGGDE